MSVTVENNQYVVVIPEESIRQEINPDTRRPFASEAEAQEWQDACLAALVFAKRSAKEAADTAAIAAAKVARKAAIFARLAAIDAMTTKSRTSREMALGNTATKAWVSTLDTEAQTLRTELGGL